MSMTVGTSGYQAPTAFNGSLWAMGTVIQGNFGESGNAPTNPPSQPPQSGGPNRMDPKLFQRYYHAFFDPKLNPYIGSIYSGDNFTKKLFQNIKGNNQKVKSSKVPKQTYVDRAAMIARMNATGILRYLEGLIEMKLRSTDVMALSQILFTQTFAIRAGRAVYEHRGKYSLFVKNSDDVQEFLAGREEAMRKASGRIAPHIETCEHCRYSRDAAIIITKKHGSPYASEFKTLLTRTQAKYFSEDWIIRRMVRKYRDHELTDPTQIWATYLYIDGVGRDHMAPGDSCHIYTGIRIALAKED